MSIISSYFEVKKVILAILDHFREILAKPPSTPADEQTFTWQDHFIACTNNPSSVNDGASDGECLGEYGGPAFPFVALGGYPKDKSTKIATYTNSTALIMSLELDNYEDRMRPEFEKAMSWEQDFIAIF